MVDVYYQQLGLRALAPGAKRRGGINSNVHITCIYGVASPQAALLIPGIGHNRWENQLASQAFQINTFSTVT